MADEIRFGGSALSSFGDVSSDGNLSQTNADFRRRYAERIAARPDWVEVAEERLQKLQSTPEGREAYGDPGRGATVAQAWRALFTLTGISFVVLLARGRPSTPMTGIPEVVLMSPKDLAGALARKFATSRRFGASLFIHDGRSGHCVAARGHDAGKFRFHDPWPGRSLLCREFNVAGVNAQPIEDGLWTITDDEFERVIFAAFVLPADWADLIGRTYRLTYAGFQESEFWTVFGLREIRRTTHDGMIRARLHTSKFQNLVDLGLDLDQNGTVIRLAALALPSVRIVEASPFEVNPYAIDVTTSFLAYLIHVMAGIRWRVSRKALIAFTELGVEAIPSTQLREPHPPCLKIPRCRSVSQPLNARKWLRHSMVGASHPTAA